MKASVIIRRIIVEMDIKGLLASLTNQILCVSAEILLILHLKFSPKVKQNVCLFYVKHFYTLFLKNMFHKIIFSLRAVTFFSISDKIRNL